MKTKLNQVTMTDSAFRGALFGCACANATMSHPSHSHEPRYLMKGDLEERSANTKPMIMLSSSVEICR
jgi:hypothetical protein